MDCFSAFLYFYFVSRKFQCTSGVISHTGQLGTLVSVYVHFLRRAHELLMKQAADLRDADTNYVRVCSNITNEEVKVETTASRQSKEGEKVLGKIFMSNSKGGVRKQ